MFVRKFYFVVTYFISETKILRFRKKKNISFYFLVKKKILTGNKMFEKCKKKNNALQKERRWMLDGGVLISSKKNKQKG